MQEKDIWKESERYVAMAEENLSPEALRARHVVGAHDQKEWLRIAFLFPTLPEKSKTDLLMVRRHFLVAQGEQEEQKTNPKICAERSEAIANEVAVSLKEALPSFTAVQREILKRHYIVEQPGRGHSSNYY